MILSYFRGARGLVGLGVDLVQIGPPSGVVGNMGSFLRWCALSQCGVVQNALSVLLLRQLILCAFAPNQFLCPSKICQQTQMNMTLTVTIVDDFISQLQR